MVGIAGAIVAAAAISAGGAVASSELSRKRGGAPPPVPGRDDPGLEGARTKTAEELRRKRGRGASVITGASGVTQPLGQSTPTASSGAELLG